MKRAIALLLAVAAAGTGYALRAERYRVNYFLTGNGSSRFLLIFSFRFYYETAGSLEFEAVPDAGGERMDLVCIPAPNYVMRTMNFSGSSLALAAVIPPGVSPESFASGRFGDNYYVPLKSASNIKKRRSAFFSYKNMTPGHPPFSFYRSRPGAVSVLKNKIQKTPFDNTRVLRLTFNPFQMAEVLLGFFEVPFLPEGLDHDDSILFRSRWQGADIDLTANMLRLTSTIEKIVEKYVKVKFSGPLRLDYSSSGLLPDGTAEVCGQLRESVSFWRDFRVEQFRRSLRFELRNGCSPAMVHDRIFMEIRNRENQQGFGYIEITRVRSDNE